MILDKNSITARLYRWFYATNEMPNSLCPYFWKLFIMWILIVPFYIFTLPTRLFEGSRDASPVKLFLMSLFIFGFLYVVFSMISFLIIVIIFDKTPINGFMYCSSIIGFFGWLFLIAFGLFELWDFIEDKTTSAIYNRKHNHVGTKEANKPSIIVEFIKASYNKYCPKIDWK